jgi:hypothetical protein
MHDIQFDRQTFWRKEVSTTSVSVRAIEQQVTEGVCLLWSDDGGSGSAQVQLHPMDAFRLHLHFIMNVWSCPLHEDVRGMDVKCLGLRIFNLDTNWRWVASFTLRSLYPAWKVTSRVFWMGCSANPQTLHGLLWETKQLSLSGTRTPVHYHSLYRLCFPGSPLYFITIWGI